MMIQKKPKYTDYPTKSGRAIITTDTDLCTLRPRSDQVWMMDSLFLRALNPAHPSCDDQWTGLARWLLYLRSHWLKMPLQLLMPHLARKAWLRLSGQ